MLRHRSQDFISKLWPWTSGRPQQCAYSVDNKKIVLSFAFLKGGGGNTNIQATCSNNSVSIIPNLFQISRILLVSTLHYNLRLTKQQRSLLLSPHTINPLHHLRDLLSALIELKNQHLLLSIGAGPGFRVRGAASEDYHFVGLGDSMTSEILTRKFQILGIVAAKKVR